MFRPYLNIFTAASNLEPDFTPNNILNLMPVGTIWTLLPFAKKKKKTIVVNQFTVLGFSVVLR